MTPARKLKALDVLTASQGWLLIQEVMDDEIKRAALEIASNRAMSLDEINFRRGAIWAAQQLLDIPIKLSAKLEAESALNAPREPGTEELI